MPYSISRKWTWRGLQKIRSLRSIELAFRAAEVTSLATFGASVREAPADATHRAEREVLADPLVTDVCQLRLRFRRRVGAGVALHLAPSTARHPIELDVVGRAHHVAEIGDHVGERLDRLDRVEVERRNAPQRHLGEHAECAEPDPGHPQQLGVGALVGPHHRAVTRHEFEPDDRRRQVAESGIRCRGWPSTSRRRSTACRCRRGSAAPDPARTAGRSARGAGSRPARSRRSPSTSRIRFIPSSDTRCPSVIAASVNEWPPPIAFTRWPDSAARRTIAATSSVVVGSCTATGTHR